MPSRPTFQCLGIFAVAVAINGTGVIAEAKDRSVAEVGSYAAAFGTRADQEAQDDRMVNEGAAAKASARVSAEVSVAMDALRQLSSFPVRIRQGSGSNVGWSNPERRSYEPKPVEHRYKAGRCEFALRTGDFTLRRYEQTADGTLAVNKDPVPRFSTMDTETNPVFISVGTEVYVTVLPEHRQDCKQLFAGRRVHFGSLDLESTALIAQPDAGMPLPATAVGAARGTAVYLAWDDLGNDLALEDAAGLAPAVESAVFTLQPEGEGDYYLALTPILGVQRQH